MMELARKFEEVINKLVIEKSLDLNLLEVKMREQEQLLKSMGKFQMLTGTGTALDGFKDALQ